LRPIHITNSELLRSCFFFWRFRVKRVGLLSLLRVQTVDKDLITAVNDVDIALVPSLFLAASHIRLGGGASYRARLIFTRFFINFIIFYG